jgi:hypothetical protein
MSERPRPPRETGRGPDSEILDLVARMHAGIKHVAGPREPRGAANEVVVACMVRNGAEYVEEFLEHYFSLGAKHVVLLDNGSTDATVALARRRRNVSIFEYPVPIGRQERVLRRYLVNVLCRSHWCLCVDIDEFFDYPFSGTVTLNELAGYLDANSYTAVVTQMLDMFPKKPLGAMKSSENGSLKKNYPYYDITGVEKADYMSLPWSLRLKGNVVSNEDIKFHSGGIRKAVFGGGFWLTKHTMIRPEGIELIDPHCVSRARCADLSAVVLHYKFTPSYFDRTREYVKTDFSNMPEEYAAIVKAGRNPRLYNPATARRFDSVEELLDDGFIVVSERYSRWARLKVRNAGKRSRPRRSRSETASA